MSGHSHAKTVMATKMANAAKKGKIFSKMARLITIAAKEGGDPATNSKLKMVIDQAKNFNMPKENIERAIKKGTGELAGESLSEVSFEGFGPGGISIIAEGITDNVNRALGEVKIIFNQNNGKLAGEGAVKWMFERKGDITVNGEGKPKEDLELMTIEAGADDVSWNENMLDVYTKPEDLEKVRKQLEEKGLKVESASLDWVAKEKTTLSEKDKESAQKLFDALDENDAINNIYSNF